MVFMIAATMLLQPTVGAPYLPVRKARLEMSALDFMAPPPFTHWWYRDVPTKEER